MTAVRTVLAAGLLLAGVVTATPASAYCDPKYAPLCTNDCEMYPFTHPRETLDDPVGVLLGRACPA